MESARGFLFLNYSKCIWDLNKVKAELNPKAATLDLYAYLVPCLVLDNIPKYKKSQSNHFLTTPTYIHTGGIADPWADWAMISNRPGNNKKGRQLTIACNGIKFSFPRFIWFCWAAIFFYFHQVLSVLWWLETLDTSGYVWALEKVSFELISPTYMFKGLSSALRVMDPYTLQLKQAKPPMIPQNYIIDRQSLDRIA